MNIIQTSSFKKTVKKLHPHLKKDLDDVIHAIIQNPLIGEPKIGDLSGIFVHKFRMNHQQTLLAYMHHDQTITLTLLALGSHENFYRDLKSS